MPSPVLPLVTAKDRLGIVSDHRDDEIQALIDAAIQHVEKAAHYYLESRDIVEALDCLVSAVDLKAWPATDIVSIDYLDADGVAQSIDNARLIASKKPAFLMPAIGAAWPGDVDIKLTATITVGHAGDANDPYPPELIQAMLLLVGHWFENHEAVVVGTSAVELPLGVMDLCNNFRSQIG